MLDTCERIAREKFAPAKRIADTREPRFDGERVQLPQAAHAAWRCCCACALPKIDAWLGVVARREALARAMQDAWFRRALLTHSRP